MELGVVLYTSTKGHFGYKDCYIETVDAIKDDPLFSHYLCDASRLAHIKVSSGDEEQLEIMEKRLKIRGFETIHTKADWSHNDSSHAVGYYADMLKCFSDPRILNKEIVLFMEDDWILNGALLNLANDALTFLRKRPEKLCVRINRDTDKIPDYKILYKIAGEKGILPPRSENIFAQGPNATPYGPTMTFQPTFVRPREWYHALRWINNAIKNDPNLLERYHCELISGDMMKRFSDDPEPFCFFDPKVATATHIGEEGRCQQKIS